MEEQRVITIQNFSDTQYSVNRHPIQYTFEKYVALEWLLIEIFLNGNSLNSEGHVSIVLFTFTKIDVSYLNCTVSVVDADGKSRYPLSFGIQGGVFEKCSTIGETSFIKRCVVLDPDTELLHEDTLTLQFDISWDVEWLDGFKCSAGEKIKMHMENMMSSRNYQHCVSGIDPLDWERFEKNEIEKFPFADMFDEGNPPLSKHPFASQLRSDGSPFCERLRDKPQYYESLFRKAVARGKHNFPLSVEFKILVYLSRDLMIFLQQENLVHVDIVDKCIVLYYLNYKYRMRDMKEVCSERLKCLFTLEKTVDILDVAELYKDAGLCDYATVHILLNWKEVKKSIEWKVLIRKNHHILSKEMS